MKGGARPGAGRPKGSVNRNTIAEGRLDAIAEAIKSGESPLEYMLRVMRDPEADVQRRDKMAAAAAAFIHPRLESVEQKLLGANGLPATPTIIITGNPEPAPPPQAVESLSNARH